MVITYLKDMPSTRRFAILIIVAAASLSAYNLLQRYYGLDAQIATCFDNDRPRPTRILNCSKLIERDDASGDILHRLLTERALIFRKENRIEMAFADIDQAVQLQPKNTTTLAQRGFINDERGEYALADADFGKSLNLSPNNKWILSWRATGLRNHGEFADAVAIYDQILNVNPDDTRSMHYKGHALEYLGRTNDAIATYKQAIAAAPGSFAAYKHLYLIYKQLENFDAAIGVYRSALAEWPDNASILDDIGLMQFMAHDYEMALVSFLRARNLRRDISGANSLFIAATYFKLGQDQRGKDYIWSSVNEEYEDDGYYGWRIWFNDIVGSNGKLKHQFAAISYAGVGQMDLALEEAKNYVDGGGWMSVMLIKESLIKNGLYEGPTSGPYDDETHAALVAFFESLNFVD